LSSAVRHTTASSQKLVSIVRRSRLRLGESGFARGQAEQDTAGKTASAKSNGSRWMPSRGRTDTTPSPRATASSSRSLPTLTPMASPISFSDGRLVAGIDVVVNEVVEEVGVQLVEAHNE
jgi:hypothetical protein